MNTQQRVAAKKKLLARTKKGRGCWVWQGPIRGKGYGCVYISGLGVITTHRLSYQVYNQMTLVVGQCVLHKCDNMLCVNPRHLFLGTVSDNNEDKIKKGRHHYQRITHCKWGHEFSGENLYIQMRAPNRFNRICRACARIRSRALRLRMKGHAK